MPSKKNTKTRNKRKRNQESTGGLTKLATITTRSLSSAITNFKKNQEQKKIKEIKLKKLQESNDLTKEKKELNITES